MHNIYQNFSSIRLDSPGRATPAAAESPCEENVYLWFIRLFLLSSFPQSRSWGRWVRAGDQMHSRRRLGSGAGAARRCKLTSRNSRLVSFQVRVLSPKDCVNRLTAKRDGAVNVKGNGWGSGRSLGGNLLIWLDQSTNSSAVYLGEGRAAEPSGEDLLKVSRSCQNASVLWLSVEG